MKFLIQLVILSFICCCGCNEAYRPTHNTYAESSYRTQEYDIKISDDITKYTPKVVYGLSEKDVKEEIRSLIYGIDTEDTVLIDRYALTHKRLNDEGKTETNVTKLDTLFSEEHVYFIGKIKCDGGGYAWAVVCEENIKTGLDLHGFMKNNYGASTSRIVSVMMQSNLKINANQEIEFEQKAERLSDLLYTAYKNMFNQDSINKTTPDSPANTDNIESKLAQLKQLKDKNIITQQEYEQKRSEVISDFLSKSENKNTSAPRKTFHTPPPCSKKNEKIRATLNFYRNESGIRPGHGCQISVYNEDGKLEKCFDMWKKVPEKSITLHEPGSYQLEFVPITSEKRCRNDYQENSMVERKLKIRKNCEYDIGVKTLMPILLEGFSIEEILIDKR